MAQSAAISAKIGLLIILNVAVPQFENYILHNFPYAKCQCKRKVRMSHICKVEVSHFPVDQAGLECGRGIDHHERTRTEPH